MQQRAGRVSGPQAHGGAIDNDKSLEDEADEAGAAAARGEPAELEAAGAACSAQGAAETVEDAPIQLKLSGSRAALKAAVRSPRGLKRTSSWQRGWKKILHKLGEYEQLEEHYGDWQRESLSAGERDQMVGKLDALETLVAAWLANQAKYARGYEQITTWGSLKGAHFKR